MIGLTGLIIDSRPCYMFNFDGFYHAGLKHLIKHYLPISDSALILDNSITESIKIIVRKNLTGCLKVEDPSTWKEIEGMAHVD